MINATEARTNAATNAEENKTKIIAKVEEVMENKISPAISEAVAEGQMSLAICLKDCEPKIANALYAKLAESGFDVSVATTNDEAMMGENWFTVYWSKDRGGEPGKITRPKLALL